MSILKKIASRFMVPLTSRLSKRLETFNDSSCFSGKNVVIIGPNCDLTAEMISRVKDADILAVVNKGHRTKNFIELRAHAREVVLFHCLDLSEETGGGSFSSLELRRKGFHAVHYPLCEDRFFQNIVAFHRGNVTLLPLRRIDNDSYAKLRATIEGFTPNTGYAAIWMLAKSGCSSLYVSGINFMRNPYHSSYHTHLAGHADLINLIERHGNHNPDLDLESFRELAKTHIIQVDKTLTDILAMPTEPMFYQKR